MLFPGKAKTLALRDGPSHCQRSSTSMYWAFVPNKKQSMDTTTHSTQFQNHFLHGASLWHTGLAETCHKACVTASPIRSVGNQWNSQSGEAARLTNWRHHDMISPEIRAMTTLNYYPPICPVRPSIDVLITTARTFQITQRLVE